MSPRWTSKQWSEHLRKVGERELDKLAKDKPRKKPEPSPTKGMDKPNKGFTICHSTLPEKDDNEKED